VAPPDRRRPNASRTPASRGGARSRHFPSIEKKHGKPIQFWFKQLQSLRSDKYVDQIELLRERHGFSREHANAVVMFHRGSTSTQRHDGPDDYLQKLDPQAAKTVRAIFRAARAKRPALDLVMAWNQPMIRNERGYVLGVSVSKRHITLNPFSKAVMDTFRPRLAAYDPLKHTFKVPLDWKVDASLLQRVVNARLAELRPTNE
jgi:uncharacterized protein YdhG (YjbR/CyaY superfamily)